MNTAKTLKFVRKTMVSMVQTNTKIRRVCESWIVPEKYTLKNKRQLLTTTLIDQQKHSNRTMHLLTFALNKKLAT